MKKLSIFLTIALAAVIYSCGNGSNGSNEQKADSLATAEQPNNEADIKQAEPQITLTVKSGELIRLGFSADAGNTQVKIISGERDTSFTVGRKSVKINYLSSSTQMIIYGDVTEFACNFNYAKLTALDISKNTALKELSCCDNNIADLNVSKNAALINLDCNRTHLTHLNVSKNTALKKLNCSENPIKSLDISKNTTLTFLDCRATLLTTLDLSKNMALETILFEEPLNYLDFSHNEALIYVFADIKKKYILPIIKSLPEYKSKKQNKREFECPDFGLSDKYYNIAEQKKWNIAELAFE